MSVNYSNTIAPSATESGKHPGKEKFITLCIPRVFMNITEKRIRHIFYQLKLGFISKIDMVLSKTPKGEKIYKVFIHFKHFFDNSNAQNALNTLQAGKEIKVIYDDPWFWKVFEYKKQSKHSNNSHKAYKSQKPPVIINNYHEIQTNASTDNISSALSESTIAIQESIEEEPVSPPINYGPILWPKKKKLKPIHQLESTYEEGEIKE